VLFDISERGRGEPLELRPGRYRFEVFMKASHAAEPRLERTFEHILTDKQIEEYRRRRHGLPHQLPDHLPAARRETRVGGMAAAYARGCTRPQGGARGCRLSLPCRSRRGLLVQRDLLLASAGTTIRAGDVDLQAAAAAAAPAVSSSITRLSWPRGHREVALGQQPRVEQRAVQRAVASCSRRSARRARRARPCGRDAARAT
jgi:hypothetical protein